MANAPKKEAVVYILDAFPSMNAAYPGAVTTIKEESDEGANTTSSSSSALPTRLDSAKRAIEGMVFASMLDSKQHLAHIIVCKTEQTKHHLVPRDVPLAELAPDEIPFPNLTELGPQMALAPPSPSLVRELWEVQTAQSLEMAAQELRGDFCDALVLAADALYRATFQKRFRRKIVLLTDACHQVVLDVQQMGNIIDSLRSMECPLHVLGLGFQTGTVEIDQPLPAEAAVKQEPEEREREETNTKRVKREIGDNDDDNMQMDEEGGQPDDGNDEDEDEDDDDDDDDNMIVYDSAQDREELLKSLTEKTGGSVVSVENMQELLDAKVGKRVVKGHPISFQFHVGPGLTVPVRRVKLLAKEEKPKVIEEAVQLDEEGNPRKNSLGQEMTVPVKSIYKDAQYYKTPFSKKYSSRDEQEQQDGEEEDQALEQVNEDDMADAIRYGAELIPMGDQDFEGLKAEEHTSYEDSSFDKYKPYIDILGYVRKDAIPFRLIMGPPYGVTGLNSRRSCTLIAALSQVLLNLGFVAICSVKASKRGTPTLAAIYPFEEPAIGKERDPTRLLILGLPFCDEVKQLTMKSFQDILEHGNDEKEEVAAPEKSKSQASDDLIDSLMLPDNTLRSECIPSPFIRSFYQTILKRAMNRNPTEEDLVSGRDFGPYDPMATPRNVLQGAQPALETFRQSFPLKKKKVKKTGAEGKGRGRSAPTHTDFLNEDEDDG